MQAITYTVTLRSPLVLGTPGGDPNSVQTLRFIPGGAVRGAAAAAFLRRRRLDDPAVDPDFRTLFLDGTVRWLHAYPEGREGQRLLPAPRSLYLEKGTTEPLYDLAGAEAEELVENGDGPTQLIRFGSSFVSVEGDPPLVYHADPEVGLNFHHQRDRAAGRPVEGSIFTYQALQPGERFVGVVLCDVDPPMDIGELLTAGLRLGRSRNSEYGKVTVEVTSARNGRSEGEASEPPPALGEESAWRLDGPTNEVVATLASDLVPVDPFAGSGDAAFLDALRSAGLPDDAVVKRAHSSASLSGGYVAVWHLPAPQVEGLAAGSVFVLESGEGFDVSSLRHVSWSGVGARRAEGFGRVAFGSVTPQTNLDPHDLLEFRRERASRIHATMPEPAPIPAEGSESDLPNDILHASRGLLTQARRRLLTAALDRRVLPAAAKLVPGGSEGRSLSKSVLGRLRSAVRNAATEAEILAWLNDCEGKPAQRTLEARVIEGTDTLHSWIRRTLDTDGTWSQLGAHERARSVHIGPGGDPSAQPENEAAATEALLEDPGLAFRYQRALIDAVLTRVLEHARKE